MATHLELEFLKIIQRHRNAADAGSTPERALAIDADTTDTEETEHVFKSNAVENFLLEMAMKTYFHPSPDPDHEALYDELLHAFHRKYTDDWAVQEVYVICKSSGYLLGHCSSYERGECLDRDLVAGMITAIQAFVHHAFGLSEGQTIQDIKMGDLRLLIEHSKTLYAAVVMNGTISPRLRSTIHRLLENLEQVMADDPSISTMEPMSALLGAKLQRVLDDLFPLAPTQAVTGVRPRS